MESCGKRRLTMIFDQIPEVKLHPRLDQRRRNKRDYLPLPFRVLELLTVRDLDSGSKWLLISLSILANKRFQVYLPIEDIAYRCQVTVRCVTRNLKILMEKGWIKRWNRTGGRGNLAVIQITCNDD